MLDNSQASTRGEIAQAVWSLRGAWLVVAIFSLVANVMMLAPTLYMLQVFDRVMVSYSEWTLLVVSLITLLLFAAMAFSDGMRARLLVRIGVRLNQAIAHRVFAASFARSVRGRQQQPAQPFADWTELRQFLTGQSIVAFFDLPWTPIYVLALFLLHPVLGWVAIGFALLQALLAWQGHRRTVSPTQALSRAQSKSHSYLDGKLRNAEAIESMGMRRPLQQRWLQHHQSYNERHAAATGLTHRVTAWSKYVRYVQQSASLALGALLVINGELSAGGMIAANVLMTRALSPIDQMVSVWRGLLGARAAHARLAQLLQDHPPSQPADTSSTRLRGEVQVRDLGVAAPGSTALIVQSLDFTASPGTLTVVLGPSGSGKSTLSRALVGVWPASQGVICLDGKPVGDWHAAALGPQVGYLPQDTALFAGTVAENIARFGEVRADKVVAAAQAAGLHEMVLWFPKGYDSPVGEGGRLLSGGQRQRIGLARALYGDPSLLVLDEPNAHLDDVGEAALLGALRGLKARGATVIMVTHRAGAVGLADQLLVLEAGRMRWLGPRDEVLSRMRGPAQSAVAPVPALLA
jgi:ATP-binding cassette subfamily C exporter for protease/lipase